MINTTGGMPGPPLKSHAGGTPVPLSTSPTDGGPRALGGDECIQHEDDRLLELLARGETRISELTRRDSANENTPGNETSIIDVAQRLMQPHNLHKLRQVAQLMATQRDILLSQLKLNAMLRLAELMNVDSSDTNGLESSDVSTDDVRLRETQRKACVDILKVADCLIDNPKPTTAYGIRPPRNAPYPPATAPAPGMPAATEEQILAALEQFGREREDEFDSSEDSWESLPADDADQESVDAPRATLHCPTFPGAGAEADVFPGVDEPTPRALPRLYHPPGRGACDPPSTIDLATRAKGMPDSTPGTGRGSLNADRTWHCETLHPP